MDSNCKEPINIGNPSEFTIMELAKLIISKVNPKLSLIHKPLPEDDPLQRKPVILKAKQILNWEPKINLEEGLEKTINYFKNQI